MTISKLTAPMTRRSVLRSSTGLAGILATGRAPVFAQAAPKKLLWAHIVPPPESAAVACEWMTKELNERAKGALAVEFHGGTLIPKELEIMNAVKTGNIAIGGPAGAAATVFPEMGAFLVPYLVKDYNSAYAMFNGRIGDRLDKEFQEKYKLKVLFFYDYGFRHFWTNKSPIVEPKDLRGRKIRVQLAKVFADTIAGLGGNPVPMAWGEVVTAAKQGVIDGGDLPIVNIDALRVYEVSKFCSMTFHNYGPTLIVMNLEMFENLSTEHKKLLLDLGREAQNRVRHATESVDNFESAKKLLEPKGMTVVEAKVDLFRKVAQERIWPAYKSQFGALWDEIAAFQS